MLHLYINIRIYIYYYIQHRVLPCFPRSVQMLYERILAQSESCTLWNIGSFVSKLCVRILYMADNGHRADKRNVILLMCAAVCVCFREIISTLSILLSNN